VNGRDPRDAAMARPPGDGAAFERWLAEGMAPDAHDHAAGRLLADAWRDRRRALDREPAFGAVATARRWRVWWWAPVTLMAVAVVAVVAWPSPAFVDGDALARAYIDAMGTLPAGSP